MLDGKRATARWSRSINFANKFPEVPLEPDRIFISDGDEATAQRPTKQRRPRGNHPASCDSTQYQYALVDINGDGLPDLVAFSGSAATTITTRLNTSSGGTPAFNGAFVTAYDGGSALGATLITPDDQPSRLQSFDFNGDGRQDLALSVYSCASMVLGSCVEYETTFYALLSQTGGTFSAATLYTAYGPSATTGTASFANLNNDGCTDAVIDQVYVILSACNGTSVATFTPTYPIVGVLDWNGDGLTDLLENNGGTLYVQLGNATSTQFGSASSTSLAYSSNCTYVTLNASGAALDDLGCTSRTAGTNGFVYYPHNGGGMPPDLLSSISDGYGNSASPIYVSTAQSNYSSGTGSYPDVPYTLPIYVTSQVTYSDPSSTSGATYNRTFQYTNSLVNVQGRGWDGFAEMRTLDSRNALYDYRYFLTSFPYTGMQYDDLVYTGSQNVFQSLGTQTVTNLSTTAYEQRYFPYFGNVTTKRWELGGSENGDLITTQSTTYTYDNYGNATTIGNTVTDSDPNSPYSGDSWTTTTTNSPAAPGTTWCLNLLTQTQVTYTATVGASVTRTKQFTPYLPNCRYSQMVTEPSSGSYEVTEALGYDSFGNINSDSVTGIGMATRTISMTWNATGQFPASFTNPLAQTTQFSFDPVWGTKTSVIDPNGITHQWIYDPSFGRLSQETRTDGTYTQWAYGDCATSGGCVTGSHGLVSAYIAYNTDGSTMTNGTSYSDAVDRPLVSVGRMLASGAYSRNEARYDSMGNVSWKASPCTWTTITAPCASGTTFQHDVVGRLTSAQIGSLVPTNYTYAGRRTTITDPNGHAKTTITDVNGLLRQTLDANGYTVTLGYDAAGSKTATTDNQSRSLWSGTVLYGIGPFTVSTTDLALGGRTYTYDALGEITGYSDSNGNTFSAVYDSLSRITTRAEPDFFTQWTWGSTAASDNIGRLASVCTGNSASPGVAPTACTANSSTVQGYAESESYDSKGRPIQRSISIPSGTFVYGYQYNTSGQLSTLTYPNTIGTPLKLQYNYSNGFLQSIMDVAPDSVTLWTANADNPAGEMTQETLGNGVVINRSFDPVALWLNSITAGSGGSAALENQSYLHDAVGNVTQRQENNLGLTENFYYDNLNRLYYSQLNSATNLQICYDNGGSGCTENVPGPGAITSKTADAVAPSSYNATWTSYNYPSKIATASESVQFFYGPGRQRWQQTYNNGAEITNYIGGNLEQVVTSSGTAYRQYVYAGAEPVAVLAPSSSGNTVTYMLSDQQGSVAALLNNSGASDVGESFTAYGARRNPSTWAGAPSSGDLSTIAGLTRQGYTFQTVLGQSMGFNHMNGRVQDAIAGQFMSPDPNIPDPTNTQDYNRYAYVRNNPLTFVDPTGFCLDSGTGYSTEGTDEDGNPQVTGVCPSYTGGGSGGGANPGGGAPTITQAAIDWEIQQLLKQIPPIPTINVPESLTPCEDAQEQVAIAYARLSGGGESEASAETFGAIAGATDVAAEAGKEGLATGTVNFAGALRQAGGVQSSDILGFSTSGPVVAGRYMSSATINNATANILGSAGRFAFGVGVAADLYQMGSAFDTALQTGNSAPLAYKSTQ